MSEQIEYKNIFEYTTIPRTGTIDVISSARMPMEYTNHYTFRFSVDFVAELKKVVACRSMSLALSWLIDDEMIWLEKDEKVLHVSEVGITSVRFRDSFYVVDARCREQFTAGEDTTRKKLSGTFPWGLKAI